jgi:hypothetical protein
MLTVRAETLHVLVVRSVAMSVAEAFAQHDVSSYPHHGLPPSSAPVSFAFQESDSLLISSDVGHCAQTHHRHRDRYRYRVWVRVSVSVCVCLCVHGGASVCLCVCVCFVFVRIHASVAISAQIV